MLKERVMQPAVRLELTSGRTKPGAKVMVAFLTGSWLTALMWLAVSLSLFAYNQAWACLILFTTIAFGWYLTVETVRLDKATRSRFRLKVDDQSISLTTQDGGERNVESIDWETVRAAEVYRYRDEASVLLRGTKKSLEIPLWAFDASHPEILVLLKEHGIPIIPVP